MLMVDSKEKIAMGKNKELEVTLVLVFLFNKWYIHRRKQTTTNDLDNIVNNNADGLYKDLTYEIIGALYAVHNELGSIHKENIYQKAVAIELTDRKINFEEEKSLAVKYKGKRIGVYRPDFIIDDKVILENKSGSCEQQGNDGSDLLLCKRNRI